MNYAEAEKKAKEQDEKYGPFCPLINGECKTDCVCYINAHPVAHSAGDNRWYVSGGSCANHMFHGNLD